MQKYQSEQVRREEFIAENRSKVFDFPTGKFQGIDELKNQDQFIPFVFERDSMGKLQYNRKIQYQPNDISPRRKPETAMRRQINLLSDRRKRLFTDEDTNPPVPRSQEKKKIIRKSSLLHLQKDFKSQRELQNQLRASLEELPVLARLSQIGNFEKKNQIHEVFTSRISGSSQRKTRMRSPIEIGLSSVKSNRISLLLSQQNLEQRSQTPQQVPKIIRIITSPQLDVSQIAHIGDNNEKQQIRSLTTIKLSKERSSSQPMINVINFLKSQELTKQQREQRQQVNTVKLLNDVARDKFRFQLKKEKQFMKEKTKYQLKIIDFDPNCFVVMESNVDDLKRRIRLMRYELNTWADKQVQVFKNS